MAQGYWLNYVYVQELKAAYEGRKYRGKVTLSELPEDELIKELLRSFIELDSSGEWYEIIPQEAVNWLNDYVPKLAGIFSASVLEKTREVIQASMIAGATLQERMKALRESSEELARMTNQRIEAIARTEITRADSMGRLISMKANDDVIGVEFSAVMDDRTTEMCIERNGLIMRLDDPRLPENTPPIHINCRSLLLSLTVYDFPDGVLTSHEFDEIKAGNQRPEDIETVRALLEERMPVVPESQNYPVDIRSRVEELIRQNEEYKRQRDDIQTQIDAAVARQDLNEYNRLFPLRENIEQLIQDLVPQLRDAKVEAAEQGIIFASGISEKVKADDVSVIIQSVEGASAPIRRVWNIFEDRMNIADIYSRANYYSPREGAVHINLLQDKAGGNDRPQYSSLFHELGHLIDDKAGIVNVSVSATDLHDSLVSEVNSYIASTLDRLKSEALEAGQNPKEIKKLDAQKAVEREISTQLPMKSKLVVSDIFGGVTKNKVNDGWGHSTSYWRSDKNLLSMEFFAQTFSDSITNPEAIEITKRYFPESYKIFERIISEIGGKK